MLEIFMILCNFKPKKSSFWPFLLEKQPKNHKIGGFGCKKSSKFEENSKMNIYSLVPHIDYPVALCSVRSGPRSVHIEGVTTHLQNIGSPTIIS